MYNNAFVVGLGAGTVFFGLICIVIICYIMSALCNGFSKPEAKEAKTAEPIKNAVIENKQEIIAAVTCAIAEELGEDVKGIRVKSFRRL